MKNWIGLGFLTMAVLTSVVDSSVMTVVTPTISADFHAALPMVEWTTTIYSLFFGATMLLWGKFGSDLGIAACLSREARYSLCVRL